VSVNTAAPAAAHVDAVRLAFIVADPHVAQARLASYEREVEQLVAHLFDVPPVRLIDAAVLEVPHARRRPEHTGTAPLVVVAHVNPDDLDDGRLRSLGDFARQLVDRCGVREVGIVIGDYYYPFTSSESPLS
jgi:hypothetical protein